MIEIIVFIVGILILLFISGSFSFLIFRYFQNRNIKDRENLEEIIEEIGKKYIKQRGNVGLVIGVVKKERTFIKGFGRTSKQSDETPDGKTIFELGSIGKIFTTSALQILADRNELSLDDVIGEHLQTKICREAKNVTLRQLATHRSGFPSFPKSLLRRVTNQYNPYKDLAIQDLYSYLAGCQGKFAVRKYRYSNLGMGILGHILEIKTGKNYEAIIKDEILDKLYMQNTTITLTDEQKKHLAQGYNSQGSPNPIWEDSVLTGAGSHLSTAEDMIRFIKANFDESQNVISKSLIKTHKRQFNKKTGLGWHYYSKFFAFITSEDNVIWHNGATGGGVSFIAINKKAQCGVIVLSNSTNDVTHIGTKICFYSKRISFSKYNNSRKQSRAK